MRLFHNFLVFNLLCDGYIRSSQNYFLLKSFIYGGIFFELRRVFPWENLRREIYILRCFPKICILVLLMCQMGTAPQSVSLGPPFVLFWKNTPTSFPLGPRNVGNIESLKYVYTCTYRFLKNWDKTCIYYTSDCLSANLHTNYIPKQYIDILLWE